jgi:hypothetical protein
MNKHPEIYHLHGDQIPKGDQLDHFDIPHKLEFMRDEHYKVYAIRCPSYEAWCYVVYHLAPEIERMNKKIRDDDDEDEMYRLWMYELHQTGRPPPL